MSHIVLHDKLDGFHSITIELARGEWFPEHEAHGELQPDGTIDTSGHFGLYVDGVFRTTYSGREPYVVSGLDMRGRQPLTGRKDRYPTGKINVECVARGKIFYLLRKGVPEVPLDFEVIFPGEEVVLPTQGYLVDFDGDDAYKIQERPQGVLRAIRRGVAFWPR